LRVIGALKIRSLPVCALIVGGVVRAWLAVAAIVATAQGF
jgi:hypothetical protein